MPRSAYQLSVGEQQVVGAAAREVLAQMHTVVGRARLLADRDDLERPALRVIRQALTDPMAHHPVSDDDDSMLARSAMILISPRT